MRTRWWVVAVLALAGCSLHRRPPVPAPARGPARDSLFELDVRRADSVAARGAVEGTLALLSESVVYLRAGIPAVYGRDAVKTILSAAASAAGPGTVWQPLGGGVSYDLRSGYTFGVVARSVGREAAPPAIRVERYIAFWQRTASRPWRIVAYSEVNTPTFPEVALPADRTTPPAAIARTENRLADAATRVRAADSLFADLSDRMGVAYAFSNTVADYGVVFGATRLAVGPAAVREVFEARPAGSSLTWRPVYAGIAGSLDLGYSIGESIVTARGASGAAVQRFGKYLTVWERQKDGTWKFVVDGGSTTK